MPKIDLTPQQAATALEEARQRVDDSEDHLLDAQPSEQKARRLSLQAKRLKNDLRLEAARLRGKSRLTLKDADRLRGLYDRTSRLSENDIHYRSKAHLELAEEEIASLIAEIDDDYA